MSISIGIIGAGIAGLSAAYALREIGTLTVFEKSRGLTGRTATRWRDCPLGRVYVDHGAQYLRTDAPMLSQLVLNDLPRDALDDIARPVWVFDEVGTICEGDPAQNDAPKWSYRQGLATLGRLIVASANLQVRTQTRIARLQMERDGRFVVFDVDNQPVGTFDHVVVAIPGPQAADLIAASALHDIQAQAQIERALRAAAYRRCLSVTLGFDQVVEPRPYYALINSDKRHSISWIGFEHHKPGHMPSGYSALVVQMAGAYSLEHWDQPRDSLATEVSMLASVLLSEDLTSYAWADMQGWKFSQPEVLADATQLNHMVDGLWFAGDYLRGGRVHLAAETGLEVAQAIGFLSRNR